MLATSQVLDSPLPVFCAKSEDVPRLLRSVRVFVAPQDVGLQLATEYQFVSVLLQVRPKVMMSFRLGRA